MTTPTSMEYLSGRARANRLQQAVAADTCAALAHGQMADLFQRRFDQARAAQGFAGSGPDDEEKPTNDGAGEDDGSTEIDGKDDHLREDQKPTTK